MSQTLPEKPSLEFLRKQAKERLRQLGAGKLADAQLAIAREYGFASWAKLKTYVQELGFTPAQSLKAAVCDSDPARFKSMSGRFSRPVLPGESLTVSIWRADGSGTAVFQTTRQDGTVVIDRGRMQVRA